MGEYLSTPNKTKDSQEGANATLKYGSTGMQGWRKSMEDSHVAELDVIEGELSVFGVFDGHGGSEVAQYVGGHIVEELKKNESFKKGNYKQALTDVFIQIDKSLLTDQGRKELQKISQKNGSMAQGATFQGDELAQQVGCTACLAIITKTEIYVANAGDTRCVIAAQGKAKDLSNDHKPDVPNEKRRVTRAGGFVEEGRVNGIIAISRAIGDWEYKNKNLKPEDNMVSCVPEVIIETLRPDHDFMIIACDGIWDCLTSQEAVNYIYEQKSKYGKKVSPGKKDSVKKQSGTSPMKKGVHKSGSGSPGTKSNSLPGFGIAKIIEMMFDKICPMNLAASEGIGTDNMSCIIIEFNKQDSELHE